MDYKNGRIYQILNTVTNDVYVGSTCQPLSKRMAVHRENMNSKADQNRPLYLQMAAHGKDNFYIELLEEFPCETKEQLNQRKFVYTRQIGTLNSRIIGRTPEEYRLKEQVRRQKYREENFERIKQTNQQYRESNQDKIKKYYEENKDRINAAKNAIITCECGWSHSKQMKARHLRSKAHINWLNLQSESPQL